MLNGEEWARLNMFNRILQDLTCKEKNSDLEVSVIQWLKEQCKLYEERK